MKTNANTLLIVLLFTMLMLSCGKTSSSSSTDGTQAVMVKTQRLNDTSSFTMSNGERCTIVAEATIDYPVKAGENNSVDTLRRLFAAYVLESGDSLSLNDAMKQVVANSMHQYDFMANPVSEDEKMEVRKNCYPILDTLGL